LRKAHGVGTVEDEDSLTTPEETTMQTTRTLTVITAALSTAMLLAAAPAVAQNATHSVRVLTPETAMKATQAALASCRAAGYQVSVAVVDRFGVAQAMWRDRFAGPHTPQTAIDKAWTAVSFRTPTTELMRATQAGQASSGIRHIPGFVGVGGGLLIEAGGSILGAVGVSGAPTGDADDACAKAGIAAIQADVEM
jgi:uncharacterized protein GlcG (DUF336 family)